MSAKEGAFRALLDGRADTEEIAPIFLLPARPRVLRIHGRTFKVLLHYVRTSSDESDPGREVFVRSHGVPFNIYPPEWRGVMAPTCVSIGPGLWDGDVATVLLAQSLGAGADLADLAKLCAEAGADVKQNIGELYGTRCAMVSAAVFDGGSHVA